jgi:hypothetical protein
VTFVVVCEPCLVAMEKFLIFVLGVHPLFAVCLHLPLTDFIFLGYLPPPLRSELSRSSAPTGFDIFRC